MEPLIILFVMIFSILKKSRWLDTLFQMYISNLYNIIADAFFSEIPCLTWELTPDKLDIVCRLDNVVLPVSIYDVFGKEQGKCEFKDFSALCSTVNKLANITASYSKGEVKLSITNFDRSLVKGEWSCIQGTQIFKTVIPPSAGYILIIYCLAA